MESTRQDRKKDRKNRLFVKWDADRKRLWSVLAELQGQGIPATNQVVRKYLGIECRDRQLFVEWLRYQPVVVTEQMRRVTSLHEAGHAVAGELLIPGFVEHAECFKQQKRLSADDDRVAPGLASLNHLTRGGVRYNTKKADELNTADTKTRQLCVLYRIVVALVAGFFEHAMGVSTPEEISRGRKGDLINIVRMLEMSEIPEEKRKEWTDHALQISDRLTSSKAIQDVVQKVADIMFSDVRIPGERVQEIIAADLGPRNQLLASLGIPTEFNGVKQT